MAPSVDPPNAEGQAVSGTGRTVRVIASIMAAATAALLIGELIHYKANGHTEPTAQKIDVEESSYKLVLNRAVVYEGRIDFHIHNEASIGHEFVVLQTALPAGSLPRDANGDVAEGSSKVHKVIASETPIPGAGAKVLSATLEPGHYAIICNLPGHYAQGMHADLVVHKSA